MCCTGIGDNESLKGNDWVRKSLATLAQKLSFTQLLPSDVLIRPY